MFYTVPAKEAEYIKLHFQSPRRHTYRGTVEKAVDNIFRVSSQARSGKSDPCSPLLLSDASVRESRLSSTCKGSPRKGVQLLLPEDSTAVLIVHAKTYSILFPFFFFMYVRVGIPC